MSRCIGCGAILQSTDKEKIGYIPPSADAESKMYCMRCFKIRNHNYDYSLENIHTLTNQQELQMLHHNYFNALNEIRENNTLVLLIMDSLDIHNGFIPNLKKVIKNSPIWVLVNKCDLYPKSLKLKRIEEVIKEEANQLGLDLRNIFFISSLKLTNVDLIMKRIKESINKKGFNKTHIFVIGTTSVGKSTFINKIIEHYAEKDAKDVITTSQTSNTTKQNIYINIGKNYEGKDCFIVDTPGYLNESNLKSYLSINALKIIDPKNAIKPKTYQLTSNQTFFIDKIVEMDTILNNDNLSVSFFVSPLLYIHRTKMENKEKIKKNLDNFNVIKYNNEELNVLNNRKEVEFKIEKEADIWLSGLGFIHIVGSGMIKLSVPTFLKVNKDEII